MATKRTLVEFERDEGYGDDDQFVMYLNISLHGKDMRAVKPVNEDQIRAIVRDEIAKSRVDVPPEPATKTELDPGEGWRLVDKKKDKPQEGDQFWSDKNNRWEDRFSFSLYFLAGDTYRRRIEPQYREPTNADIGKIVEVCDPGNAWAPAKLCCVLYSSYSERFAVEMTGNCFTFQEARIRCDGGDQ